MTGRIIQGKLELLDKIGQGGMATVYRARQLSLDRIVAVKILSTALFDLSDIRDRFRQEAKIIARLTHPNIVQVHDIYEIEGDDGSLCIVMEYLEGQSLHSVLAAARPLPIDRSMAIAEQVACGLSYAHGQGVVHRDIKPQNVMLLPDDRVKIMDFGIAHLRNSSVRTQTGTTMGTPEYMSPEQAEGKNVDCRTDIYSLGIVLYCMVTGELPFSGDSPVATALKQIKDTPRPPRAINPNLPPSIEAIITRAMAKRPSDRFQSAEEFRQALSDHLLGSAGRTEAAPGTAPTLVTASTQTAARRLPLALQAALAVAAPFVRRNRKWIAAAGGLWLLLMLLLIAILPSGDHEPAAPQTLPPPAVQPTPATSAADPFDFGAVGGDRLPLALAEIEWTMRRLNQQLPADPDRARLGFESAQAAAKQLAVPSDSQSSGTLISQCLNGFIMSILYDRSNWLYYREFAVFLLNNTDMWDLPSPIRIGLFRDAHELLRRAQSYCTDPAELEIMTPLEQRISQLLQPSEAKGPQPGSPAGPQP